MSTIQYFVRDLIEMPIIISQSQDLWLGLHGNAPRRLENLQNEWCTVNTQECIEQTQIVNLYARVLALQTQIIDSCEQVEVEPPNMLGWLDEALHARIRIHDLRLSRVRRFNRNVSKITDKMIAQELSTKAFEIAGLICLFPCEALRYLTNVGREFGDLPSLDVFEIWMADWTPNESLMKATRRRAKVAKATLATGYLRYALRMSRNYVDKGLDYEDLVQEASIGLLFAADKYDYLEHPRFAIYATTWIWQRLNRAIADQSRTIRLPVHAHETWKKIEHTREQLLARGIISPTAEEIALEAELFPDDLQEIILENGSGELTDEITDRIKTVASKVERLLQRSQPPLSLENMTTAGSLTSFEKNYFSRVVFRVLSIGANYAEVTSYPEIEVMRMATKMLVTEALESLTPRQRRVVELRFGLIDGQQCTLEDIGRKFDLTRERIRQIEKIALTTLRHPDRKRKFSLFLNSDLVAPPELLVLNSEIDTVDFAYGDSHCDQDEWEWLDQLLDELPGGGWRRASTAGGVTRQQQLIDTLHALAIPSHYADITEQLNGMNEGEDLEETYIYSLLVRYEDLFMPLGQGVFSLIDWERERVREVTPVLPFCPQTLPDPPNYKNAFFESVFIARSYLAERPVASKFLAIMLDWAETTTDQPKWMKQSILSAYYLVGLIPYTFYFDEENPRLICTLPDLDIQVMRHYCLEKLTERLETMPEFWWLFQRRQPVRPGTLGEEFADIHPNGLDDTLHRLYMLTSLGAAQRLPYGYYKLTPIGESCAQRWQAEPQREIDAATKRDVIGDDSLVDLSFLVDLV